MLLICTQPQLNSVQDPWVQSIVFSQSISPKGDNMGSNLISTTSLPLSFGGSKTRSKILRTTFLKRPASMKLPSVGRIHSKKPINIVSFCIASDRDS